MRIPRWLPAATFALFVFAGYFKADPRLAWLPVDLTLLGAAGTAGWIAFRLIKGGGRVPKSFLWPALLFASLAVPVLLPEPLDLDKVGRLFTITLLAAAAPFFLVRSLRDSRVFMAAFASVGILLALNAIHELWTHSAVARLESASGNTIALGRAAGISVIWLAGLLVARRIRPALGIAGICLAAFALIGAGSRGPLLFAALSVVVLLLLSGMRRAARLLIIGAVCATLLVQSAEYMPSRSLSRVARLLEGGPDRSIAARTTALTASLEIIEKTPQGIGWGGFAREVALWGSHDRQYPHNIVVEIALEAGWVAALAFLAYLAFALRRASRHKDGAMMVALCIFVVLNAMVSGDINDNRIMFAVLGIAIARPGIMPQKKSPPDTSDSPPIPSYQLQHSA